MIQQELIIPGPLLGLNDCMGHGAYGFMKHAKGKKLWTERIALLAKAQGFRPVSRAHFSYLIIEPNRRRDPSNFCFGAAKFIEDALQAAGLLQGDGWEHVLSFTFSWETGPKPSANVLVVGEPWEASPNEREEKGKNKFRRGTSGDRRLQALARKAKLGSKSASSSELSARGNAERATRGNRRSVRRNRDLS